MNRGQMRRLRGEIRPSVTAPNPPRSCDKVVNRPVRELQAFAARMVRAAALCAIVLAQATAFVAPPAATPALTARQGLLEPYGSA